MSTWLRIVYSLLVIVTAMYGIVIAVWTGKAKKTKLHLKLIGGYLVGVWVLGVVGIILACIYVRKTNKYDMIFIVATCFVVFLLTTSSIAFGYALKKTKLLRRMNTIGN